VSGLTLVGQAAQEKAQGTIQLPAEHPARRASPSGASTRAGRLDRKRRESFYENGTTNDERLKKSLCIRKNTEEGDEEDQDGPGPLATSRYIAIDTVLISGNRLYKLDRRIPVAAMVSGYLDFTSCQRLFSDFFMTRESFTRAALGGVDGGVSNS
jgi:hypothetical protein